MCCFDSSEVLLLLLFSSYCYAVSTFDNLNQPANLLAWELIEQQAEDFCELAPTWTLELKNITSQQRYEH